MNKKIINEKIVKIRKTHNCYGCGRTFGKNTNMSSAACKINNMVVRKYFCEACHHQMITKAISFEDFCYGELLKEALLYENNPNRRD